jgi:pimeloyl-ACP methyl ester carboxylesterase/DNA-binding winged helix-turn-helix (wHTH) protein
MQSPAAFTFGRFRLEPAERRLTRDGEAVALPGKAFDTLLLLVESAGTLQTQKALMDRLWPDTFVEPNNLQYTVSLIRRALGEDAGVEIQTVRGQGYRLVAAVERHEAGGSVPKERPRFTQHTHFTKSVDGARIAYARSGEGPPIVKAANWLNHLELDWEGPIWRPWIERLGQERCLVRYDARGNGLSHWDPPRIAFEDFVSDLEAVFDAARVERAPLVGISQGASVAVSFAARHPERVSALVLIGGCARGWRVKGHPKLVAHFEALMVLMRQGWGGRNAAFRQIFSTAFFPEATREEAEWFNELQRQTTSPEGAVRILSALGDVDVRDALPLVRVPTLVVHSREDTVIPMSDGIELASGIPEARFLPLESANHLLLSHEPAWARFSEELEGFLASIPPGRFA